MGQRSQIYIHFNVRDSEGMIARYFQWNYGVHMVSRARSIIEFLESKCRRSPFMFKGVENITRLNRFCDIDFDMRNMDISVDILEYCKSNGNFDAESVFGQPNNDGQLLIDVTDNGIRENIICNIRNLYKETGTASGIAGCNGSSVERCIRHLIERALSAHENEENKLLYEIFGDVVLVEKKITNKRFIAQLVEYIKTQTDSGKEKMT